MDKEEIKRELENYVYDYQYYIEKTEELEKNRKEIQNSITRVRTLSENSENQKLNENLNRLIEKEAREEKLVLEILEKKQFIEDCIKCLKQPERTILYMRYIRFYSFETIAEKMHYCKKRIYQLHALALEHLSEFVSADDFGPDRSK